MPSDEFQHLATRTDILEREVEGEKMVTRHLLEQTRLNGGDIAEIKSDVKGLTSQVDGLDGKVDGLDRKVDGLSREFREWRHDLPGIISDIMRDAIKPLTRKR